MKYLLLIMTMLFSLNAQTEDDKEIRKTIGNYFEGYKTGNVDLLKKAFHPDVVIKYVGLRDKKYSTFSMPELHKFMNNLPQGWTADSEINSITIHGTAAQAQVTVKIPRLTWTDFISLLKLDGQWTIVAKISHGDMQRRKKN